MLHATAVSVNPVNNETRHQFLPWPTNGFKATTSCPPSWQRPFRWRKFHPTCGWCWRPLCHPSLWFHSCSSNTSAQNFGRAWQSLVSLLCTEIRWFCFPLFCDNLWALKAQSLRYWGLDRPKANTRQYKAHESHYKAFPINPTTRRMKPLMQGHFAFAVFRMFWIDDGHPWVQPVGPCSEGMQEANLRKSGSQLPRYP